MMLLEVRTPGLAAALGQINKAYTELDGPEPDLKRVTARISAADKGRLVVAAEVKTRLAMPKIVEADARIIEAEAKTRLAAPSVKKWPTSNPQLRLNSRSPSSRARRRGRRSCVDPYIRAWLSAEK